ncbi:MAG TPA: helix-turn-helix domain-containing protein [Nitrososphaeraceae archaeon]
MDTGDTRSIDVLEVISNHNRYKILKLVSMKQDGTTNTNTSEQLSKVLELTKKQLYFRIKKLVKTGLVKRQNGKISTTILGNSVINAMRPVHDALRIHIQLKAMDTFALSGGNSKREINLLIDTMIEDGAIRKMIKKVPSGFQ